MFPTSSPNFGGDYPALVEAIASRLIDEWSYVRRREELADAGAVSMVAAPGSVVPLLRQRMMLAIFVKPRLNTRDVASAKSPFRASARSSISFHDTIAIATDTTADEAIIAASVIAGKRKASVCWTGKA